MSLTTEITPEGLEEFYTLAEANGKTRQDAEGVYKIITELAPPTEAFSINIAGIPVGNGSFRPNREYDTAIEAATGRAGLVELALLSDLGEVRFLVDKAAVLAALQVEVPYVAPPQEPAQP